MSGWREAKRQMRRDVHETMLVPAIYVARLGSTPLAVTVRPHTQFGTSEAEGMDGGYANMLDVTPRIRFDRREIDVPTQNAYVAIGPDEIYRVDAARPPDDTFIYANVTQISVAEARALPFADWVIAQVPAVNVTYDQIIAGVSE